MSKAPWLDEMKRHLGDSEDNDMPEIQRWIREVDGNPRREAWCADALNHCLKVAGIKGTGSPAAASFLTYGVDLGDVPQDGCIVVFKWTSGDYKGHRHVTIYDPKQDDVDSEHIACIGGNQNRMVRRSIYPVSEVEAYRMPEGYSDQEVVAP